jgi:hypothetical protein
MRWGWAKLSNGELLRAADSQFDLLITTDQSLRYQQNLVGRRLAILVLPTTSWPIINSNSPDVVASLNTIRAGDFRELEFPQ